MYYLELVNYFFALLLISTSILFILNTKININLKFVLIVVVAILVYFFLNEPKLWGIFFYEIYITFFINVF